MADRVLVLQPVGTGPRDREDPARGARPAARAGRPQPRTQRRTDRLPERQGCRHRRPRSPAATTPGRRSTAASGSSSPTPSACCWSWSSWPPRYRTATAPSRSCSTPTCAHRCGSCSPTAGSPDACSSGPADPASPPLHIVRKPADQRGFAVIPRRWAVERTFAWLTAHRRLARDYERDPAVSEAMIRWAAINTISRRIARGGPATRQQRRIIPCHQLIFSNTFLVVISAVSPPNDARSCLTLHQPTPDKHTPPIATHVDGGHGHHLARTTQRKTKAATRPSRAMTPAAITTAPTRGYGSGPGACGGGDVGVGDPFRRRPLAAVVRGPPCQDDIYIRRYRDWSMANRPNAANPSATAVSRNLPKGCARMVCMAPSSPCAFCGSKVSVA